MEKQQDLEAFKAIDVEAFFEDVAKASQQLSKDFDAGLTKLCQGAQAISEIFGGTRESK